MTHEVNSIDHLVTIDSSHGRPWTGISVDVTSTRTTRLNTASDQTPPHSNRLHWWKCTQVLRLIKWNGGGQFVALFIGLWPLKHNFTSLSLENWLPWQRYKLWSITNENIYLYYYYYYKNREKKIYLSLNFSPVEDFRWNVEWKTLRCQLCFKVEFVVTQNAAAGARLELRNDTVELLRPEGLHSTSMCSVIRVTLNNSLVAWMEPLWRSVLWGGPTHAALRLAGFDSMVKQSSELSVRRHALSAIKAAGLRHVVEDGCLCVCVTTVPMESLSSSEQRRRSVNFKRVKNF